MVNIVRHRIGEAGPLQLAQSGIAVPEIAASPVMPADDIECIEDSVPTKPVAKQPHARRRPKKTATSPVPAQHFACSKPASILADVNGAAVAPSCQARPAERRPARVGAKAARVHRAVASAKNAVVTLRCFIRPR